MRIDFAISTAVARSDSAPGRWRLPFLRWLDTIEKGRAVPLLLVAFVAVWMGFLTIAYLCGDPHPDVLEMWLFSRDWGWGNSKHPPLAEWIVHLWTAVFPLTNWSFQLLAMTNSAIALWSVDLISRHFVRGDKRIIILLLLMLTPTYQFHAQRFNANAVLLVPWPIATLCFLRSFESRNFYWAAAAGATSALAVLGKYYSVFLVGSFVFAAIVHPQRRKYLGSMAPWVSTLAGLTVLAPHLHWLATTGLQPLNYALDVHKGATFRESAIESLYFLGGLGASMSIAAVAWCVIAGQRLRQFADDFRKLDPGLYLLFLISIGTIVFPIVATACLGSDLPSLWALQGLFLFAVPVVCAAGFSIERVHTVNLAVLVLGIAIVSVLIAAPIHAAYRNVHPFNEGRNFYRSAAIELGRRWHDLVHGPLPLVSGSQPFAFAAAAYLPEHPNYQPLWTPGDPWAPSQARLEAGWAAVCSGNDDRCIAFIDRVASSSSSVKSRFTVQSDLLGWPGATAEIHVLLVPAVDGLERPSPLVD
jgi:4-amino-4-deoxy-L-arabinose transferase-like glycosyltransferase